MKPPAHPRKSFFLRNSAQPRLLIGIELIFLTLLLVSGVIFYVVANRNLVTTYSQAHLRIKNVQDILLPVLILINAGGLALGAVLAVFFTHRIAGPVFRLCRILRQAGEGNLAQAVHFRDADELKELDAATTEMLAALAVRVRKLQALSARLNAGLGQAAGADLAALQGEAAALEKELAAFRLPPEAQG